MNTPKGAKHIKDAPRDGRYVMLVKESGLLSQPFDTDIAKWADWKDEEDDKLDEIACWRGDDEFALINQHEYKWYYELPWQVNQGTLDQLACKIMDAVQADMLHTGEMVIGGNFKQVVSLLLCMTRKQEPEQSKVIATYDILCEGVCKWYNNEQESKILLDTAKEIVTRLNE